MPPGFFARMRMPKKERQKLKALNDFCTRHNIQKGLTEEQLRATIQQMPERQKYLISMELDRLNGRR